MNITLKNGLPAVAQSLGRQGHLTSLPWTFRCGTSWRWMPSMCILYQTAMER